MQLEFSWQFLKNTRILNFVKSQDVPSGCTDRWTDRQADTHDEANRHFYILHLYLKSKYGVNVVGANITEVMLFPTVEVVGFTRDCTARFVK
jgi:hypothetical protein